MKREMHRLWYAAALALSIAISADACLAGPESVLERGTGKQQSFSMAPGAEATLSVAQAETGSGSAGFRSSTNVGFFDDIANLVESLRGLPLPNYELPGDLRMQIRVNPNFSKLGLRVAFVRKF